MKTPWSATDLELDELWADPESLAVSSPGWARQPSITNVGRYLDAMPDLFAERPVVLAHGDFAPVNVLTDGEAVTGLLDFEAVRLADLPSTSPGAHGRPASPLRRCSTWLGRRSWMVRESTRPNHDFAERFAWCMCCACSNSSPPARSHPTSRAS